MAYHKLLEKQIRKYLDPLNLENETICHFLEIISNSYSTFEREKIISDHAFMVSEKEYQAMLLERDEAEKSSRFKSEFLANMSHEIRTPLNGIVGMIDMALETKLTSEQLHYLDVIRSSSETLMGIINDILDFSKIEAGKLEVTPVSFSFRDEIPKALQALGLKAFEKKLELIFRLGHEVPDLLVGDVLRLKQVITNLLGNAIKFTENGEVALKVSVQSSNDEEVVLHFTVSDTGIGIPEEKLSIIFEEFIQVNGSGSRYYGGTGLGLAISRRLVQMMGGIIWVESKYGHGSAFHFTLPFKRQLHNKEITLARLPELENVRVLVVEDNHTASSFIHRMLERSGMKPVVASNGEEAFSLLKKNAQQQKPFSMVLLDISLEGRVDGYMVAKLIRKNNELKDTPVIVLSMSQKPSDRQRFARLGITHFLSKPFNQAELLNDMRQLLAIPATQFETSSHLPKENDPPCKDIAPEKLEILLVEDNLVNQEVALSMLTKQGHKVTVAKNGQEAIARYRKKIFDVVLMDVQMPVMNGYEASRKIREIELKKSKHTPIIGLTANAMNGDRKKCLEAGMDDYVSKPVRLKELVTAIQRTQKKAGAPPQNSTGEVKHQHPVNMELLLEKMDGDQNQLQKCLDLFRKELPALIKAVENALQQKKSRNLKNACHDLRGMLLTMEMIRAVTTITRMETLAAERKLKNAAALLPHLDREIHLAIHYIETISA
jgi:two-component system, sensor histidine kinase and response regulator